MCVCYIIACLVLTESLLDVKKQRLLLSLQGLDSHSADGGGGPAEREDEEEQAEREEREEKRDKGETEKVEDDDELRGIKCRAPLEEVGPL